VHPRQSPGRETRNPAAACSHAHQRGAGKERRASGSRAGSSTRKIARIPRGPAPGGGLAHVSE
jgi:hypothetical protein